MRRRAEKLADRVVLDRFDAGQGRTVPRPDREENFDGGISWHKRSDPARGIMLGVAIGTALWALMGLAVLAWLA